MKWWFDQVPMPWLALITMGFVFFGMLLIIGGLMWPAQQRELQQIGDCDYRVGAMDTEMFKAAP